MKNILVILCLSVLTAQAADLTPAQKLWGDSVAAEQSGVYTQALALTAQIIKGGGDGYLANLRMGWLHWMNADAAHALPWYQKASRLTPGAVTPLLGIMNCSSALGQTNEALRAAKLILQVDPMNYTANAKLGELNYLRGDYAAAAAYYGKLSALFPEDIAVANGYAWSALNLGKAEEARAIFENILIVYPGHASAAQGFASCGRAAAKGGAQP